MASQWHSGKTGKGLLLFFIGIYHPLKTFLSNLYSEGHSATFSDVCFRSNRAKGYVRPPTVTSGILSVSIYGNYSKF